MSTTATTAAEATDRIERSILIQAPRSRVWRALSDAETFGRWFGADLAGQRFAAGERTQGRITIPGFTHVPFDVIIERVEPEHTLVWRWHPYAVDPKVDYEQEERTRVTFTLKDAPGGATLVVATETGFDRLFAERRLEAFRMNGGGWTAQLDNLRRHAEAQ